jgi:hypothetical protein
MDLCKKKQFILSAAENFLQFSAVKMDFEQYVNTRWCYIQGPNPVKSSTCKMGQPKETRA